MTEKAFETAALHLLNAREWFKRGEYKDALSKLTDACIILNQLCLECKDRSQIRQPTEGFFNNDT